MTYYVVHQTIIIIVAYYIAKLGLLNISSFIPVMLITAIGCGVIGEAQKLAMRYLPVMISRLAALVRVPTKLSPPGAALD